MATVPHITSGSGLRNIQADGFLFDKVYMNTNMKWKNCLGSLGLHYKWVLLFLYLNFFFSFFPRNNV